MNVLFPFMSFNGISQERGMYGDLVIEFARKGHNVFVVAPIKKKGKTYVQQEEGVTIIWVKTMSLLNVGMVKKAMANLLLPYYFQQALVKHLTAEIDLIVTPTPPITLGGLIGKLKKRHNAKFFLILRDIFPQNAVDLGLMRKGLIYKILRSKERMLYLLADKIGCMSQGNIDYIQLHNPEVDKKKLMILPNWLEMKESQVCDDEAVERYALKGKFVALFGGNLGIAQQPENILELARLHSDKTDLLFLIIGKGLLSEKIKNRITTEKLHNVKLINYLPRTEYQVIARYCKVGLVSLNDKFTIPNIPSRTFGYWSEKLPLFAIVDQNTDYGETLLDRHKAGLWCKAGDKKAYVEQFNKLYHSAKLREEMGLNGLNALREHYNTSRIYHLIINDLY